MSDYKIIGEKPQLDFKQKLNPLVATLPNHLKDPRNYKKIRKLILESLAGKCSHGEMIEWASCEKCQRRFYERGQLLKKLGFKNNRQYMEWQKVHEEIIKRFPLVDWSKINEERSLENLKLSTR